MLITTICQNPDLHYKKANWLRWTN